MTENLLDTDLNTALNPKAGINQYNILTQFIIWVGIFFGCTILISWLVQKLMYLIYHSDKIISIIKSQNSFLVFYYFQIPATIVSFLIPALIFAYLKDKRITQYTQTDKPFPVYLLVLVPVMLYVFYVSIVYPSFFLNKHMFWADWLKEFQTEYKYITENMLNNSSVLNLILCFITVALLPAICEEFLFRGTLQKLLNEKLNIHIAVILSSIIFSLVHFDFSGFLPRIILGMFLGYLFYYSGSLWTSIFAHAVNNGAQVVFMYLNNNGIYKMDVDNPEMPKTWEIFVYTAVFAGLWCLFYHFAQKRKNSTFV